MTNSNSLLRSAYAIALRKGKNTNWEAFANRVKEQLYEDAGIADLKDEQTTARYLHAVDVPQTDHLAMSTQPGDTICVCYNAVSRLGMAPVINMRRRVVIALDAAGWPVVLDNYGQAVFVRSWVRVRLSLIQTPEAKGSI
jgi:hypothetical protein